MSKPRNNTAMGTLVRQPIDSLKIQWMNGTTKMTFEKGNLGINTKVGHSCGHLFAGAFICMTDMRTAR